LLRTASGEQPHLIAIEDMHWANAGTLHLLAQLAATAGQCAAVVAMTTRFVGDPFEAGWRAESAGALSVTVDLRALRPEDAVSLATGVIAEVDDFARECIVRAEGNPLFLEQLLRSRLIDSDGKLPHSLQGVVLARLDSLAEADRRALQAASVLGQRFVQDDLRALLESPDYDCRPMIQRQLLRPEGEGYLFAHALIRDGVYASLTRQRKRDLHLRAAAQFEARDPALWAEHLDLAGDPSAPRAYRQAAEAEAAAYRLERAIALATRGLELATRDDDLVQLGLAAGRLRLDGGLAKPAREAFAVAVAAATDARDRCRGLIGLAAADRVLADLGQALENLRAAEEVAAAMDSPALLSEIHYMRGNLHFARGEGEACLNEHRAALQAAEQSALPEWKARALSGLGDAAYLQGRMATAKRHFQGCVELAERHNLLRVIPANQCMIGDCMALHLEFDGGLKQITAARAAAIRIGDRFCEMFASQSECYVLQAAGRLIEAEAPTEIAMALAIKLGARRYEAFQQMALGEVRLAQNRIGEAQKLLDAAMALAEETGLGFCGPMICGVQAEVLGPGDAGRAWIVRGEQMLAQANLVHNHVFFQRAAIDWAIAAGDWPLVEHFAARLSDYAAAEPFPYVDLFVRRARALAALAHNRWDAEAALTLRSVEETARAVDLRLQRRESV
jgi:tetratricopeptide (TPR) repeat protein